MLIWKLRIIHIVYFKKYTNVLKVYLQKIYKFVKKQKTKTCKQRNWNIFLCLVHNIHLFYYIHILYDKKKIWIATKTWGVKFKYY